MFLFNVVYTCYRHTYKKCIEQIFIYQLVTCIVISVPFKYISKYIKNQILVTTYLAITVVMGEEKLAMYFVAGLWALLSLSLISCSSSLKWRKLTLAYNDHVRSPREPGDLFINWSRKISLHAKSQIQRYCSKYSI